MWRVLQYIPFYMNQKQYTYNFLIFVHALPLLMITEDSIIFPPILISFIKSASPQEHVNEVGMDHVIRSDKTEMWSRIDGQMVMTLLCIFCDRSWGINTLKLFGLVSRSCHGLWKSSIWDDNTTITCLDIIWCISVISFVIYPQ